MKLLYITGLSGRRVNGFMRSAILAAREMNIDFTMVSNMSMADKEGYKKDCEEYGIKALHIDLNRNPISRNNKKAYEELYTIINRGGTTSFTVTPQLVEFLADSVHIQLIKREKRVVRNLSM